MYRVVPEVRNPSSLLFLNISFGKLGASEVAQLCPTLCYPMEYSPPGSSVHEIFQARILEWIAIFFSRGSSQPKDQTLISLGARVPLKYRQIYFWNGDDLYFYYIYKIMLFSHQVMSNSSQHPWTIARQTPPSMGFPRQEYWSGLPFSSLGNLPNPGIKPSSPALSGGFFTTGSPGTPMYKIMGKDKYSIIKNLCI